MSPDLFFMVDSFFFFFFTKEGPHIKDHFNNTSTHGNDENMTFSCTSGLQAVKTTSASFRSQDTPNPDPGTGTSSALVTGHISLISESRAL